MTYLEIVTKLANLADLPYSSITDVATLTGELAIVADWAKSACFDIQNKHNGHWKFLHSSYTRDVRASKLLDASAATDIGGGVSGIPIASHGFVSGGIVRIHGTTNYDGSYSVVATTTASVLHITATYVAETFAGTEQAQIIDYEFYTADGVKSFDKQSFYYYLKSDGANKATRLRYVDYKRFIGSYADYSTTDKPRSITVTPDRKLRIYPAPNDVYVIGAESYLKPTALTANADEPPFLEEFHDLVVYKGLIDYAGFEESSSIWTWASSRYQEMYKELE